MIFFQEVDILQFEFCMTSLYTMFYTMLFMMHIFAKRTWFNVIITALRQNKFLFYETTSVLFVKQEIHKIICTLSIYSC